MAWKDLKDQRCMPWPMAIFCWIDNWSGCRGWACPLHDNAYAAWSWVRRTVSVPKNPWRR